MSTLVEAKIIISGQDQGASAAVRQVVNAFKQMGEATKISAHVDKLTRSLLEQTKAQAAVAAAMKARGSYDALQGDLKRTNAALAASAKAYDDAKKAKAAFDGVKAAKGSDQARQITEAARAVREAGAAHRKAEGDVRRVNAAVSAQASVMKAAEGAAAALGANLSNLAGHERKLKAAIDRSTASLKAQMHADERGARMTMQPGNASPGIGTTGMKAFGLDGIAEGAAKAGQDAGAKAGDRIKQGIDGKRSEVIGSAQQTFVSIQAVFGVGVTVPVRFDTSGAAAAAATARQVATAAAPTIRQGAPAPTGGGDARASAMARSLPAGGGMNGAADRIEAAASKMADASLRAHHTVEVSASPGLTARTRGMQASGTDSVRASVGISMPGARDSDWA